MDTIELAPYGECNHLKPTEGLQEVSNPLVALYDIYRGFHTMFRCFAHLKANSSSGNFMSYEHWIGDVHHFSLLELSDVVLVFGLAVLWTVARLVVTRNYITPLSKRLGVLPELDSKFIESAWKLTSSSVMWGVLVYIAVFREHHLFARSMDIFSNWSANSQSLDLKLGYFLEASYYLHACYATLYIDARRSDTQVMLLHHVVTLALIVMSYVIGFLKIGFLIFVLDDVSDILLELGKLASYLKWTKRGYSPVADNASLLFGVLFAVSWFFCRIICHLTKVWRAASLGSVARLPFLPVPYHVSFNILLGILYLFYCYWFALIIRMISSILRKRSVDDSREEQPLKKD